MEETYLDYLSSHQNDQYWIDILNTSYDMLPHKLEILNSEHSKNKYEIKKVVIENLDDYLSSKDTAIKMTLEIDKNKSFIKNALELINQEMMSKVICDSKFYNETYAFLLNNGLIFEADNLIKTSAKPGNEENLVKLINFINKLCELLSSPNVSMKKLQKFFEKITEKIRLFLIDKILSIKYKNIETINEIIPVNSIKSKQDDLANELFKRQLNKNILAKMEKLRPYKGKPDFFVKIFYIYSKSLENSLQKIIKLFDNYNEGQKDLHHLTNFQKFSNIFEKNFNRVLKNSCEDESFLELLNCFKMESCYQNCFWKRLQNLFEDHMQKLSQKFLEKLKVFIRYAYINNYFILLKKVDNNNFDDLWNIMNMSNLQKNDKFSKFMIFTRKNDIFSLIYNDVIVIFQFFSYYLRDKENIEIFNKSIIESLKQFVHFTRKFFDSKKNMKEDEKNKILVKIEKFLEILFFMIKNNYLL